MHEGATVVDGGVETDEESRVALKMPEPKGYKILIAMPQPDKKTQGGILKANSTLEVEEVGSIVGLVTALGPDACGVHGVRPLPAIPSRRPLQHRCASRPSVWLGSWLCVGAPLVADATSSVATHHAHAAHI